MGYRCFRPVTECLSEYVSSVWVFEDFNQAHSSESVLPTGTVGMAINLDGGCPDYGGVAGVRSRPVVIPSAHRLNLLAVHFKPGGAYPFFGVPIGELQDEIVPLDLLWGEDSRLVQEQLLHAGTPRKKCHVMETYLARRLTAGAHAQPAVLYALRELRRIDEKSSVADIREKTGYSAKRFIQLFRNHVGAAPKLFQRIGRFHSALRLLEGKTAVDWVEIAHNAGYFDQAHFNHEFYEFSGLNPSTYLHNRITRTHVRVTDR